MSKAVFGSTRAKAFKWYSLNYMRSTWIENAIYVVSFTMTSSYKKWNSFSYKSESMCINIRIKIMEKCETHLEISRWSKTVQRVIKTQVLFDVTN